MFFISICIRSTQSAYIIKLAFTCDSISGASAGGVHEMEAESYRNDLLIDKARKNDSLGDPTSPRACSKPVQTIHIAPITVEKKKNLCRLP